MTTQHAPSKIQKLQERLINLKITQSKTTENIKKLSAQLESLQNAEQLKLVKKLTNSPEALKILAESNCISKEELTIFSKNGSSPEGAKNASSV